MIKAPVLTAIQTLTQNTLISGTLTSKPKTTFTIEFYANSTNAASGRVFLGSEQVKTNSEGLAMFTFVGPSLQFGADFVTATAIDPSNNTSEFSNAVS